VFVSGHPGHTSRDDTVAELEYERDVALPERLFSLAEYRGALTEFARKGAEERRIAEPDLFRVENSYKALRGRFEALVDPTILNRKRAAEEALRARVRTTPAWEQQWGDGWTLVARAVKELEPRRKQLAYLEGAPPFTGTPSGFRCRLFEIARTLVRGAEELPRPNERRLREFRDSARPSLEQRLFSKAPIHDELEVFQLRHALTKMREELGADDPFVRKVLGKRSPDELAHELVAGTKLRDVELRRRLWQGGAPAVAASDDAMILLARRIDSDGRAVRRWYEDDVEALQKKGAEKIAKARFAAEGTKENPDATFTLRLSYGAVRGWSEAGREIAPFTRFGGLYERATGRDPFRLPERWVEARGRLDPATPFDLVTTNDIIGGNSGSPVFNASREIVGLVFDGNIHSLGGEYGFDEVANRAVAVSSTALLEALDRVYGAARLVEELRPRAGGGAARPSVKQAGPAD
jgi:hypothetical protein